MIMKLRVTNSRSHELGLLLEPEGMYVPLEAGESAMVIVDGDEDEVVELVADTHDGGDIVSVWSRRRKAWSTGEDASAIDPRPAPTRG